MDVKRDNPAGRLYLILDEAKDFPDENRTIEVLSKVLNCEKAPLPRQIASIIELQDLYKQTVAAIEATPNANHELLLADLPPLAKVAKPEQVFSQWKGSKQHITPMSMKGLAFCAEELSRSAPEPNIPEDILAELQSEIEEVAETILSADLPADLKPVLIGYIEGLRLALVQYRLRGREGLVEALEQSVGGLILRRDDLKERVEPGLLVHLGDIVAKVHSTTVKFLKLKEIATPLLPLLIPEQTGQ